MPSSNLETIASTLGRLATPDMKPKELLKAARQEHPQATKKDIVRAAFYSVIASAGNDPERASRLHDFALAERSDTETEKPVEGRRRLRKKTKIVKSS